MHVFHSLGHVFGGTLLIASTTIGVGTLALPIVTGEGGFIPATIIYLIIWGFMICTGLLVLEACSWMPPGSNYITMMYRLLGLPGKMACWITYLFLFITIMTAHVVGGGVILSDITNQTISLKGSMLVYVLLFSPIIYFGTLSVDRMNIILISGLVLSYLLFVFFSYNHVQVSLLHRMNWSKIWMAIPVLFTAFTFQVIIPTLYNYMNRDVTKVRHAIFYGMSIPLVVYLVWELLVLGIVPAEGPNGLIEGANRGWTAIEPLSKYVGSSVVLSIGEAFAFFTLMASYVAISLAYIDFLADGLKMRKKGFQRILLWLLVFAPPTFIGMTNPDIFLMALNYAGGFSLAILFGIFPPLMVWCGRYVKKIKGTPPLLGGGRLILTLLVLFSLLEISITIWKESRH
jgi:tyrosine-specific transport protein